MHAHPTTTAAMSYVAEDDWATMLGWLTAEFGVATKIVAQSSTLEF